MKATIDLVTNAPQHWLVITELELAMSDMFKSLRVKLLIDRSDLKTVPKQRESILIEPGETEKILLCWGLVLLSEQAATVTVSILSEGEGEQIASTILSPPALSFAQKLE